MKIRTRFLKSVIATARTDQTLFPWVREGRITGVNAGEIQTKIKRYAK